MTCHCSERKLVPLAPLFGPLRTTLASARPCLFARTHTILARCPAQQPHSSNRTDPVVVFSMTGDELLLVHKWLHARHPHKQPSLASAHPRTFPHPRR